MKDDPVKIQILGLDGDCLDIASGMRKRFIVCFRNRTSSGFGERFRSYKRHLDIEMLFAYPTPDWQVMEFH